jgi:hypothetical protein
LEADNEDEVKGAEGGQPMESVSTTHHNVHLFILSLLPL